MSNAVLAFGLCPIKILFGLEQIWTWTNQNNVHVQINMDYKKVCKMILTNKIHARDNYWQLAGSTVVPYDVLN